MTLPAALEVVPVAAPVGARIAVPGSKSETNRALILAALGEGRVTLYGALWSDDTEVMVACLRTLGVEIEVLPDASEPSNRTFVVDGCGGDFAPGGTVARPVELYVGNAGTATRFLTALVALGDGAYKLSGTPRMHERPQGALFAALRQLGYRVDGSGPNGDRLPVVVHGAGARPGACDVSIEESSQFASALLLCAAYGEWEVTISDANAEESPYVSMTEQVIDVFPQTDEGDGEYQIEGDASSASYLVGANLLAGLALRAQGGAFVQVPSDLQSPIPGGDPIEVTNWPHSGWQFDERFGAFCEAALRGEPPEVVSRTTDLADSILTAIVVAPLLARPVRFVDLDHLRVQECDRVAVLYEGLTRCGARVEMIGDDLLVYPSTLHGATIETYEDHRIAMCFTMLGLFVPGMVILNPSCVSKTFPNFFEKLAAPLPDGLGATFRDPSTGRAVTELGA
ncbi:MAG: 3-phosphoshikimate 1-carboxyvinyltransferase [Chloroflexota bacterium]